MGDGGRREAEVGRPWAVPAGVSLAIQVGGASRRMGGDKALLPFGEGTLLEWLITRAAPSFRHAFIVAKEPTRYRHLGLPVVIDSAAESSSIVGIQSAVLSSPTDRVLCLACDMPFVTPTLLRRLVAGSAGWDAFIPRHGAYFQPLCAVYDRRVAGALEDLVAAVERRIDRVFDRVRTGYLDVGGGDFGDPEILFLNVNTREELQRAVALGTAPEPAGVGLFAAARPGAVPLSPRVADFVARAPVPTISFVGKKKSGKTSVLLGVIAELVRRGIRVGVLKHDTHGFDIDVPGTDSYRLREAGATVTGISSPEMYVWVSTPERERDLAELVADLPEPVDLFITEGFKNQAAPKIEVSRRERSTELICSEDELLGIVSNQGFPSYRVRQLGMDDVGGIVALLEASVLSGWAS
jgi:molybdopterin-guanine dinucleotide biosynthesis protein MobB